MRIDTLPTLPSQSVPLWITDDPENPFRHGLRVSVSPHPIPEPSEIDWLKVARIMLTSRLLDELEEKELTPQGKVKYQFSARGHELSQALLSQYINHPHDGVSGYYRNRPFMLGYGMSLVQTICSGMANAGSMSGGRDVGATCQVPKCGAATILPMVGDIGAQYSPGVGWAQSIVYKLQHLHDSTADGAMALIFGGDGSVASNGFWSALNTATVGHLPLLFVIEDNGYAISVKGQNQTPGGNIAANLASFKNLTVWDGDGTDPVAAANLIHTAVSHVRAGKGVGFLRLTVPRLSGHSSVDNQTYKSKAIQADEWSRDPIAKIHQFLVPARLTESAWQALNEECEHELRSALRLAEQFNQPDESEITRFVFSDPNQAQEIGGLRSINIHLPGGNSIPTLTDPRRINTIDAIRHTLEVELSVNDRLIMFGEDVGVKGGVHAATLGLQQKFGDLRVFDTSLNEEGIVGRSIGMATAGLMPVPEIQFRKYADAAQDQLMTVGTIRWRTAGRYAAPMVIRMPGGFRKIGDPWHSVNNEVAFAHWVGLKVAFPSNAEDAVGLLRTALRGDDPVIFFEHRYVYDSAWARRAYPGDAFMLPFGKGKILAQGDRLTVVTWGAMTEFCETALQHATEAKNQIELIDLRTIVPWDKDMVLQSVRKTGKCLIVHEDTQFCGFGAEIAATLAREAFFDLDAPIERVGAPSTLTPYSQHLLAAVVPTPERITKAMRDLILL